MFDESTKTLVFGDLFTQGGMKKTRSPTEVDILESSETFRKKMDYYSHSCNGLAMLERFAATAPSTLACMHGSAWRGYDAALLRSLAASMET